MTPGARRSSKARLDDQPCKGLRELFISACLAFSALLITLSGFTVAATGTASQQDAKPSSSPAVLTAEQDHRRLLGLLKIANLRPGANPRSTDPSVAPNYDEAKANPFPNLPDPLTLKNGKKVTSAKTWWNQRRAEIVEDFDREVYGR